ncbi:hypothetical protein ACLK11_21370 [Escherichia coli]
MATTSKYAGMGGAVAVPCSVGGIGELRVMVKDVMPCGSGGDTMYVDII